MPSSRLVIDCQALEERFRSLSLPVMPMVKGNGYGLGMVELAYFYERLGIPFVGVSHLDEALTLRNHGYRAPILSLSCDDPQAAAYYDITLALNSLEDAKRFHHLGKKVRVHLQLDLGLSRFGFKKDEAFAALPFIHQSPFLELEGVMSHFGCRKDEAAEFEAFAKVVRPKWIHMASSKYLELPLPSCNLLRLGMHLICGLKLESQVVAIKECEPDDLIGYGGKLSEKKRRMAILSIGYHDGLHLAYQGKGYVNFAGQKAPYLSNIYMDFLVVDITGLQVKMGDWAEIFGPTLPLEEVASWASVNPRQLLSCLGPRVKREYVNIRESLGAGKAHCAL